MPLSRPGSAQRHTGILSVAVGCQARPGCCRCRAVSQKAEMTMSRLPPHLVVWPNSTSNAFPVGGITVP